MTIRFTPFRPATLVCATLAGLTLASCQTESARTDDKTAHPPSRDHTITPARKEAVGDVESVTEVDGLVLAELPLGSEDNLEVGTFLRVYDAKDSGRLKGMIQSTEVLEPHRSVARLITLTDRKSPLQTGDHVHVVADLSELANGKQIEQAARAQEAKQDHTGEVQQQSYTALREQYQRSLAESDVQHQIQLQKQQQEAASQLKAAQSLALHELEMQQLQARTELAALKATMAEQVAAGIAANHRTTDERMTALVAEKASLQAQIDTLLKQQGDFSARITALVSELAQHDRSHKEALAAEVETREVLSAHISDLEARLTGKDTPARTILANEPGRSETILDRLTRVTKELTDQRIQGRHLQETLTQTQQVLETSRHAVEDLQHQIALLAPKADRVPGLDEDLAKTRTRLADVQAQRDALELRRLQAERALYDVAARVLRLTGGTPQVVAIQVHLREMLDESGLANPTTAHPPAPTPGTPAAEIKPLPIALPPPPLLHQPPPVPPPPGSHE